MLKYYTYLIKMSDGYVYTGQTNGLRKRIKEHQDGKCPLTKNRGKIVSLYYEIFSDRKNAAKREKEIKGWRRSKKEKLMKNNKLVSI